MNIVLLSFAILFGLVIYYIIPIFYTSDSIGSIVKAISVIIFLIVYVYSIMNYLGLVKNPIMNGQFREEIIYRDKEVQIIPIPKLEANLTDHELYKLEVKRLND